MTTDQKLCPQESPTSPDSGISSGSSIDEPNSGKRDLTLDLDSKDAAETHFPFPKGKALKTRITFPLPSSTTNDVALSSVPNIITATAAIAVANSVVSHSLKSPTPPIVSPVVSQLSHQSLTSISISPRPVVADNTDEPIVPLRDDEELSDDSSSDSSDDDDDDDEGSSDDDGDDDGEDDEDADGKEDDDDDDKDEEEEGVEEEEEEEDNSEDENEVPEIDTAVKEEIETESDLDSGEGNL